jgi:cytochrome c biogenesis protein CcmG/thiol:disulfide interchange protein DsbE
MKLRYLIAITIAGILIGMSAYHYLTRLGEGDPAPGFSLPDITHDQHTLDEYRGDVVAVHFWATWCDVCVSEMTGIENIYSEYKDRGFKLVSVLEDEHDAEAKLQAFKARINITFPVLLDPMGKVAAQYQSYSVPETFFIDRDGVIVKRVTGRIDWNGKANRAYIESLLKK